MYTTRKSIVILVDSQAAVLALDNYDTNSQLVRLTKNALKELSSEHDISIQWIKARVNNKGNEIADRVAKTGSKLTPSVDIEPGKAFVKKLVDDHLYVKWNRRWQTQNDCRQTFQFYPFVDRKKCKDIVSLNRYDLGILVRYTTGHAHLRRHNKIAGTMPPYQVLNPQPRYELTDPDELIFDNDDSDIRCRLCKLIGRVETPYHILQDCLAAWGERRNLLGEYTFEGQEYICWEPSALVRFFKTYDLENQPN